MTTPGPEYDGQIPIDEINLATITDFNLSFVCGSNPRKNSQTGYHKTKARDLLKNMNLESRYPQSDLESFFYTLVTCAVEEDSEIQRGLAGKDTNPGDYKTILRIYLDLKSYRGSFRKRFGDDAFIRFLRKWASLEGLVLVTERFQKLSESEQIREFHRISLKTLNLMDEFFAAD